MFQALWDGPSLLSWGFHAGLAVVYTLVAWGLLRVLPRWTVPAAFAGFFYGIRELEGYLYSGRPDLMDRALDVIVPVAAAVATAWLLARGRRGAQ